MHNKWLLLGITCSLFGLVLAVLVCLSLPSASEEASFQKLAKEGQFGMLRQEEQDYERHQWREGVRKDFLVWEDKSRRHALIAAESSELILVRHGEETDLMENLKGLRGIFQELEKKGDKEVVMRFNSVGGLFNYPNKSLKAQDVNFVRFLVPLGEPLKIAMDSSRTMMRGSAGKMEFSFDMERIIRAGRVKLTVLDEK